MVRTLFLVNSAKDLEFSASSNVDGSQGNKPGRRRELSTLNDFFMVLVRMRPGLFEFFDLAHRFCVHVSTKNRMCISWFDFLYLNLPTFTFGRTESQ